MTAQAGNLFKIAIATNAATTGPIAALGSLVGGTGYTNGTHSAVALTGGTGSGATANIVVSGGVVTSVTLVSPGTGYTPNDSLSSSSIGAGSSFTITVSTIFKTFAAARSNDWTISNTQVDVTNQSSSGWTTLLQGAGTQKMSVTVQGVVQEGLDEQALATAATGNAIVALNFTNGFGDTFTGNFAVSSYKRSGTYNGEEQFSASFDSSGVVTYTAG